MSNNTDAQQPQRLFIDCSHTLPSGLNTGVQRVVRNVCNHAKDIIPNSINVVSESGEFRAVDMEEGNQALEDIQAVQRDVLAAMPNWYKKSAEVVCKTIPISQLRRWFLPKPGHQGIFKLPLKLMAKQKSRPRLAAAETPKKGDVLLIPDAYWAYEEIWPIVDAAKQRGAFIVSVVYDLIPMTHPHFVAPGADVSFQGYLGKIAKYSNLIVAISDTVRDEVAAKVAELWPGENVCQDFRSFELGAQFKHQDGFIRSDITHAFDENAPYLMVGTIDPRKNHGYLLEAFEQIWQEQPELKLCFIGSISSKGDKIIERIWSHPRYGSQLLALHNVSDAELNYAYEHARAVCFPSIVEGFGLPIVEAQWYGREVFASDTKIHREVGKDGVHYCDLQSPQDLARQVLAWENQGCPASLQREIKPKTWQESTEQLLDHCRDAYAARYTKSIASPQNAEVAASVAIQPAA